MAHLETRPKEIDQPSTVDPFGAVFQPDLLLPSQMGGASPPASPCRRLVIAVLERALLDAVGKTARGSERAEAHAWFASTDDAPFSFLWIASTLGFEADWLRGRVSRAADTMIRSTPPMVTAAPADRDQDAA